MTKLNRRQFLKLAGVAAGALAVPTVVGGYNLWHASEGDMPPSLSPYAPSEALPTWPASPTVASPILLLINDGADNPFGPYLAEILRTEGLNGFQVGYLSTLDSAPLDWFDLVILAEGPLNTSQADRLESFVKKGGRLMAMRPDSQLASRFGVESVPGSTAEGYLQVDVSHPIGQGIVTETLQFHGVANHYRSDSGQVVAWLASDAKTRIDFPAVSLRRSGQGQFALWAFDLSRSIAYTRQGNPAWANQARDSGDGIRPNDMFKGWVDLDRLPIPQADEQQRLLTNLITALGQDRRPQPRLWYFPGEAQRMFIVTSDCHTNPAPAIEDVLTRVERRNGHGSIYYAPPRYEGVGMRAVRNARFWASQQPLIGEPLTKRFKGATPSDVANWRARGHEFALHPYVEEGLQKAWTDCWQEFTGLGFDPVPPTVRTHRIQWTGWAETARIQAAYGMRLNLDYYHWGPMFQKPNGEWAHGHFTGSGLPTKFVDEHGRILNIFQQLTQMADDHLLNLFWGGVEKISAEAALDISRTLLTSTSTDPYSAIAANFHVDPFFYGQQSAVEAGRWLDGTLDYAVEHDIPIWSAVEWLQFVEARHDAVISDVAWYPETRRLVFNLASSPAGTAQLAVMVPLQHSEAKLDRLNVDGTSRTYGERVVGAVRYAWTAIEAGAHQITAFYL